MKRKIKWKNVFLCLFILICFIVFIFSLMKIIHWKMDSNKAKEEISDIENTTEVTEIKDNKKTEIIEQEDIDEDNPYWDYIKMNLISVDFKKLKEKNKDTTCFIKVNGTNINYPVVQTKDNDYYLTHSFDKTYNEAGWVFLDYRNSLSDRNMIIYAHGRLDNIMFGTLKNVLTSGWLKNTDNYVIKLSTEKENTLWQVFSVYRIPTTSDYLQINFNDNKEFKNFAEMLKNRSDYNFNTNINENDRIITLSTCFNKTDKLVMHAKLIKREVRS